MGRRLIDLTGLRFHRLEVVAFVGRDNNHARWLCRCDCGGETEVFGIALRTGATRSCGCLRREMAAVRTLKHGERGGAKRLKSKEYKAWDGMRQRCSNPKAKGFEHYGGRGIKVCPRWDSFEAFLSDMGRAPSPRHTVERKNRDGDYGPDNCVWADWRTQARNRSNNRLLLVGREAVHLTEIARRCGISRQVLSQRLAKGWPVERAMSEPVKASKSSILRNA